MPLDDRTLRYLASLQPSGRDVSMWGAQPQRPTTLAGSLQQLGTIGNRRPVDPISERQTIVAGPGQGRQQTINVNAGTSAPAGAAMPSTADESSLASQAGWAGANEAVAPYLGDWRATPAQILAAAVGGYQRSRYAAQQDIAAQRQQEQLFGLKKQELEATQAEAKRKQEQAAQAKAMVDALPPEKRATGQTLFALGEFDELAKFLVPDPTKAPEIKDFYEGGQIVQKQWTPEGWQTVGAGPRWDPNSGVKVNVVPNINIANEKQANAVQEFYGKKFSELQDADMKSGVTIGKLDRLDSLLSQLETGKLTPASTEFKATLKGLGIDLASLGLTDDVAPAQAAEALANEMALDLRNPSGGAGMPGTMSDSDRSFLKAMVPGLATTAEGRRQIMESRKAVARREQQIAKMARDYAGAHGAIDQGFFDQMADYSNKNPLFSEAPAPQPPTSVGSPPPSAPAIGTIDGGYRFKGGNPSDPSSWEPVS